MKIEPKEITVRALVADYHDDGQSGVRGYGGKLDIRPSFQREFVYNRKQSVAVIESIKNGFPLNTMYWNKSENGAFEIIDGQQRTISIARYVVPYDRNPKRFSVGDLYFNNLQDDAQQQILNYKLQVYVCEGTDTERLDWFEIINTAGVQLTKQELRNAVYPGPWLSDAKRYFSRPLGPAYAIGNKYVKARANRQEYLETAIRWIKREGQTVEGYMAEHQHDKTATALWTHFQSVINRVEAVFPNHRKFMKGVDWGGLYVHLKNESLDPETLEADVARLMQDDDVTKKAGIYPYLLTREEKHLSIRAFTDAQKQKAFDQLDPAGVCLGCKKEDLDLSDMEADHITPWTEGGKTNDENCQLLCRECNRRKSNK